MQDHLDDLLAGFRSAGNRAEFADEADQVAAMVSARWDPVPARSLLGRLRGRFSGPAPFGPVG